MALEPPAAEFFDAPIDTDVATYTHQTLGSYTLLEEIGRGGMGLIYKAAHRGTGSIVALKTVLPRLAECEETLARFQREAEAAAELLHPNIMPIYGVGTSPDGVPFFTMQFAPGGSLYDLRERYNGRWRQSAELMAKLSRAVHYAHSRGLLHRDLKPSNVLFTDEHEPLVADFGLAKRLIDPDDLTKTSTIIGTPNYVAPEQAAGQFEDISQASDVYSLGAIFFELLTGRPPFVGDNPLAVLRQVTSQAPPEPRQLVPTVPKQLQAVCMRCLAQQPGARYQSAEELADDLDLWLQGKPISSRPSSRVWVPLSRVTIITSLAALLGIIAVAATIALWPKAAKSGRSFTMGITVVDPDPSAPLATIARVATDELRHDLSMLGTFRIAGTANASMSQPSAVLHHAPVASLDSAQALLCGMVRRSGLNVRLALRLLRSDDGAVIWRHSYTFPSNDTSSLLPAIGRTLSDNFEARWEKDPESFLTTEKRPIQPEALTFCARAKELTARVNGSKLADAVSLLQRSVAADPKYAEAHALLAYAYWFQSLYWGQSDKLPLALSEGTRAVSLDPDSALAHRAIAGYYFVQVQYGRAEEEYWKALEASPDSAGANLSMGTCLSAMGNPDKAIPWIKKALNLDRVHGEMWNVLAETLVLLGKDDEAEAALKRGSELSPEQADSLFDSSVLKLWQKQYSSARELCTRARDRDPDHIYGLSLAAMIDLFDGRLDSARQYYAQLRDQHVYRINYFGAVNPSSALAYICKRTGEWQQAARLTEEARTIDEDLLSRYPGSCRVLHDLAAVWSVAGDHVKATDYFQRAVAAGWTQHRSTLIDPRFDDVRSDPDFEALLSQSLPARSQ